MDADKRKALANIISIFVGPINFRCMKAQFKSYGNISRHAS